MQTSIKGDLITRKRFASPAIPLKRKRSKFEESEQNVESPKIATAKSILSKHLQVEQTATNHGWINHDGNAENARPKPRTPVNQLKKRLHASPSSPKSPITITSSPVKSAAPSSPLTAAEMSPTVHRVKSSPTSPSSVRRDAIKSPYKSPIQSPSKHKSAHKSPHKSPNESPTRRSAAAPKSPHYSLFRSATPSPGGSPIKPSVPIGQHRVTVAPATTTEPIPAYKRHKALLPPSLLPLSDSLRTLQMLHDGLNRTVQFLSDRGTPFIFHKNAKDVEVLTKRTFALSHLQQIIHLVPDAFKLSPAVATVAGRNVQSCRVQIINSGIEGLSSLEVAEKRRSQFQQQLLNAVHAEHEQYLRAKGWNITYIASKLRQWHPKFPLDRVEIPLADLGITFERTGEFPSFDSPNLKREKLIEAFSRASTPRSETPTPSTPTPSGGTAKSKAASMLERIRAKEKQALASKMFSDPDAARRTLALSRLPDIAKAVHCIFAVQKRKAMVLQEMATAVHASLVSPLSLIDTIEHLEELSKYGKDWISIVTLESGPRVIKLHSIQALPSVLEAISFARQ